MPTIVCTAKASCKKLPGLLELTDTHLQWTQDGKKAPSIRVAHPEANSLFCSKESAPQVRLKIGLQGNDAGHNFTFTAPQPVAYQERERFKKELTAIIARNRSLLEQKPPAAAALATPAGGPASSSVPATPLSNGGGPGTPRLPPSRAASVAAGDRRGTPAITGSDPSAEFRLRKKVLMNNPELGSLHRDLVMTGQITEAEFWDGREHLILAQAAAESQRKGKPGQIVDPRPETVEGETKFVITTQLTLDIFDEYPIVRKIYNEHVPNNLSEAEFWKRYFESKLFNAHRASIRSTAAQHIVKDDPIFDKYLEKVDDGIEPRRERTEKPDLFLSLGATNEDHGEATMEPDVTMKPGRQKGALPLIRKFNEHSERLLNSALGDLPPAKRRRVDTPDEYRPIEIEDLRDEESSKGILLEMQDRQRYFEGNAAGKGSGKAANGNHLDARTLACEARNSLEDWERALSTLKLERLAGDSALKSMTQNVAARLDVRSKKNDIPVGIFRQMTACQTAANEFLRQYWTATLPPPPELQAVSTATREDRAAKAAKMVGYLSKTHEKVQAIVMSARAHDVDGAKVEVAMKPVLDSVNHALAYHKNKEAAAAQPRRGPLNL